MVWCVCVASPAPAPPPAVPDDPYRNSGETMRMKTAHLDRKLSATARYPQRSTVVESPSGRMAQPTDVTVSTRGAHTAQPQQSHPGAGQSAEMHARSQAQTHMHGALAPHPTLIQT